MANMIVQSCPVRKDNAVYHILCGSLPVGCCILCVDLTIFAVLSYTGSPKLSVIFLLVVVFVTENLNYGIASFHDIDLFCYRALADCVHC